MVRLLAVSSGGGHWQQLQLLVPAFGDAEVTFACSANVGDARVARLPDCNLRTPLKVLMAMIGAFLLVAKLRPDVVVSTGAAPGVIVLMAAKLFGCRTIWLDSVANAEKLSLSGRMARRFADLWMTQWPQVSRKSGAVYAGAVL